MVIFILKLQNLETVIHFIPQMVWAECMRLKMTRYQVLSRVSGIKYPPPLCLVPYPSPHCMEKREPSAQRDQRGEGAGNCRKTFGGSSRRPSLGAAAVELRFLKVASQEEYSKNTRNGRRWRW
jgi:hypothetical protein